MGYLRELHNVIMLGETPPGTCPMCAVKHDPEQPHNKNSLAYQYKFYDLHGRWPSWMDAMAHCSKEVQDYWASELQKRGEKLE